MPPYVAAPGSHAPVKLLQPGVNGYAFGSFDASFPTTEGQVSNVSLTSNVATVTLTLNRGKIPAVGALITIKGTSTSGGLFNVSNVAIATVAIDPVTGIGTVTFALINANVASTPDTGTAYVPVPEVGEAVAAGSSQAFALPDQSGLNTNGITITMSTSYPSQPSTVTATLQAAMVNQDSAFVSTGLSLSNTAGEVASINLRLYRFLRVVWSNVSGGTNPTGVVRLSI